MSKTTGWGLDPIYGVATLCIVKRIDETWECLRDPVPLKRTFVVRNNPSVLYYILWMNLARAAPLKSSRNRPTTREFLFIARLAEMD